MKKLSEYENEEAIELLGKLIEPVCNIFADKELKKAYENKSNNVAKLISIALKNNSKSVIEILATLNGVKPKDYKGNIITMTKEVMEILNDDDFKSFFISQGQSMEQTSSISALENTEG